MNRELQIQIGDIFRVPLNGTEPKFSFVKVLAIGREQRGIWGILVQTYKIVTIESGPSNLPKCQRLCRFCCCASFPEQGRWSLVGNDPETPIETIGREPGVWNTYDLFVDELRQQLGLNELLTKSELRALCDRLLVDDPDAVKECVAFFQRETTGLWHGRARAMMARRLKHCRLTDTQRRHLTHTVLVRFIAGQFSEQFKDQLRLVLHLEPEEAFDFGRRGQCVKAEHVRRYADWILSHETKY